MMYHQYGANQVNNFTLTTSLFLLQQSVPTNLKWVDQEVKYY